MLRIPQSSSITAASPSYFRVITWTHVGGGESPAEMQSVYSATPQLIWSSQVAVYSTKFGSCPLFKFTIIFKMHVKWWVLYKVETQLDIYINRCWRYFNLSVSCIFWYLHNLRGKIQLNRSKCFTITTIGKERGTK